MKLVKLSILVILSSLIYSCSFNDEPEEDVNFLPEEATEISHGVLEGVVTPWPFSGELIIDNHSDWWDMIQYFEEEDSARNISSEYYVVDFSKYHVVVVFDNWKVSNEHTVRFNSVKENGLSIQVNLYHNAPTRDLDYIFYQAYTVVLVPNNGKEIIVNHEISEPQIYYKTVLKGGFDAHQFIGFPGERWVINEESEWINLLDSINRIRGEYGWPIYGPTNEINFEESTLIGVIEGGGKYLGCDIFSITDIYDEENQIRVRSEQMYPLAIGCTNQVYHFVSIPKTNKQIVF